jgi:hypothetical protein
MAGVGAIIGARQSVGVLGPVAELGRGVRILRVSLLKFIAGGHRSTVSSAGLSRDVGASVAVHRGVERLELENFGEHLQPKPQIR